MNVTSAIQGVRAVVKYNFFGHGCPRRLLEVLSRFQNCCKIHAFLSGYHKESYWKSSGPPNMVAQTNLEYELFVWVVPSALLDTLLGPSGIQGFKTVVKYKLFAQGCHKAASGGLSLFQNRRKICACFSTRAPQGWLLDVLRSFQSSGKTICNVQVFL